MQEIPRHGLHVPAEAQQSHEKVQRPCDGCREGGTIPQASQGCISLKLQEEEEEVQEASWQLKARLSEELTGNFPARLTDELANEPTLEHPPGTKGASHTPITKEALWGHQQAPEQEVLEQDPQHKRP